MPKLPVSPPNRFAGSLSAMGFVAVRQTGSHIITRRQLADSTITVPVPNHSEIARGTLKSIIDQSELPRSEFMNKPVALTLLARVRASGSMATSAPA